MAIICLAIHVAALCAFLIVSKVHLTKYHLSTRLHFLTKLPHATFPLQVFSAQSNSPQQCNTVGPINSDTRHETNFKITTLNSK